MADQGKGRREAKGEMQNPSAATSSQTEGFYGFGVRGRIYSSLGFMFLLLGCKEVRVGCCCYDVRLWSEIDDELIKKNEVEIGELKVIVVVVVERLKFKNQS